MTSLLDEDFYKSHVSVFEEIELQNSLLLLTHGQCISMYHLLKKEWCHFFNSEKHDTSNKLTKRALNRRTAMGTRLLLGGAGASSSDSEGDKEAELATQEQEGFSDHCYFNRKPFEVSAVSFMQCKSDNFYEFLVCMQNGRMRKVSVIFPTERPVFSDNARQLAMTLDDADVGTAFVPAQKPTAAEQRPPKISCQSFTSKCFTIKKKTAYSALSLQT